MLSKVEDSINVEVFELSPLNEATITTKGRLRRDFPGAAIALSVDIFQKPDFQAMLRTTLVKMSRQRAAHTIPKARKAGQMHDETRDTTHPKMVTELLMSILRTVGTPAGVSSLRKNTREEVMWLDSLLPWRRSPLWLLTRVAIQTVFSRAPTSPTSSGDTYKRFMVFFMSHVLQLSHKYSLLSDLLYAMNAKIARRLLKLHLSAERPEFDFIRSVMQSTDKILQGRWSSIMAKAEPRCDLFPLERLDFGQDVANSLPELDEYIEALAKRKSNPKSAVFQPKCALATYQTGVLPKVPTLSTEEYSTYNLRAFEDWVASDLEAWLKKHKHKADTCRKLGDLMQTYHSVARPVYSTNPEAISTMLLTIFEIWIACDESATYICDFLNEYDPGIPQKVLCSLLLPFRSQMERLVRVEEYLNRRRGLAKSGLPRIFCEFGLQDCFSVRYFNQSSDHMRLLKRIQDRANQMREKKCEELVQKKEQHRSLMKLYNQSSCEYEEIYNWHSDRHERHHCSTCRKCCYLSQANSIEIQVHEWPLPSGTYGSQSTVFELEVPCFFGHWRDTTVSLLQDVLGCEYPPTYRPRSHYTLQGYQGLNSYFTAFTSTQRIGILSQTKPHEVTHRRLKAVDMVTRSDICVNNGLQYDYYDNRVGNFVDGFQIKDEILNLCTYQLPVLSKSVQQFICRPAAVPSGPSPNTVIASQSSCPDRMSLDEYKALCAIPLGYRIQWQNILLQLSAPSVDFKMIETGLVVLQSIYQSGPSRESKILRAGHDIVNDDRFAHAVLESLDMSSKRVQENWESSQALSTFISLSTRLLTLTSASQIRDSCLSYLGSVRVITFGWVSLLRDKAHTATNNDHSMELLLRSLEIALICAGSFDVDERYLKETLASQDNASVFIKCSIIIQEGNYTLSKTSAPALHVLHRRWKLLSYRIYAILAEMVLEASSQFLDDAIAHFWPAYEAGDGWRMVQDQARCWLVSNTAPRGGSGQLQVHFNLLTGELLVNGLPLARLPSKCEQHPAFRTLFGNHSPDVMPTAVQGMQFSVRNKYAGASIHIGLRERDLLVQAVKGKRKYELVPPRTLHRKFPTAFTDNFVHWYDFTDDCLEFRPVENPWTSSVDHWRIKRANPGSWWRLRKHETSLISIESETAKEISRILSPLEDLLSIHIIFRQCSSSLEIQLPRLRLAFHLDAGQSYIRSRQYRGMLIDTDQSLGTLVGLRNKLILKHETEGNRLLIVPEGLVSYHQDGDHVMVSINKNSAIKAHAFLIDSQIARLVDNGSLQSKLYLCYLHALTSFCLSDPFLQRSGTEQALSILGSAAVRSFDQLAEENVVLLRQIAKLAPERSFYPAHERVMQTVKWLPELGFLTQHGEFYKSVTSILVQGERSKIFYPESCVQIPELSHANAHLLERDCIRTSTFRVSGFGAECHTVKHDAFYKARDRNQTSAEGSNAFTLSRIIYRSRAALHYVIDSGLKARLWAFFSANTELMSPDPPLKYSELVYDAELLLIGAGFVSKNWCALHRLLSQAQSKTDRFHLMIWFGTIAFAQNIDMETVQTLASFLTIPEMAQIPLPTIDAVHLSEGAKVERESLRKVVRAAVHPIRLCPEANLSALPRESSTVFNSRKNNQYQKNQNKVVDELATAVEAQWPCKVPAIPTGNRLTSFESYVEMSKAMRQVKPKFAIWFDNHVFLEYLGQIEHTIRRQVRRPLDVVPFSSTMPAKNLQSKKGFIDTDDLLTHALSSAPPPVVVDLINGLSFHTSKDDTSPRLFALIGLIQTQARSKYEKTYTEDLGQSLVSLQGWVKESHLEYGEEDLKQILLDHLNHCKEHVRNVYNAITFAATTAGEGASSFPAQVQDPSAIAASVGQLPRVCPVFFLQQLTRSRWHKMSKNWKVWIVHYGLALTGLQRAERLLRSDENWADLVKELQNPGHTNWDPLEHPESLLLEVESGIMIREVQEQVAEQMRCPDSKSNAVMQLNMGEGKSSVIVPIVVAALANGSRLVRVIVAKPQSKQMAQMLISKLGGLLERRVYHMPVSRSLRLGVAEANIIANICRECMTEGGVLLVQPEHILSFKLMGLECLISDKIDVACSILSTQEFFESSSRDIVDESDENFSVKFELIYTMGMQRPVELSPERWNCIHQVLELVRTIAPIVEKEYPSYMEINAHRTGSFPRIRILQSNAQDLMWDCLAKRICETGLNGFPIARQPEAIRKAVFKYITVPDLTRDEISQVEKQGMDGFWGDSIRCTLLLLRGLMAGGVLPFVFGRKRWRVNYGLDSTREPPTRLAVPYRAKDSPTLRSEFSHPDVVILLSCLCYYYSGLGDDDLFLAYEHLLKSEYADIEYQAWVKDAPELPSAFRQLVGINLKDRLQCIEQAFPHIRFAKSAIDYFLAHVVFPKEMKEFPQKLSASGWDLGQKNVQLTTGFSGTNDSRKTLPVDVQQLNLPEQAHTNALVLEHLLQPENCVALIPQQNESSSSDAEMLLRIVARKVPPVKVILDVGAQILELSNLEVAREWLKIMPDQSEAQAALFFDDDDELSVIDRQGHVVESLQTSAFAKQLDVCLVYLDEVHTRGIDLRLPDNYRAAVTLGANLTKDRLVQGKSLENAEVTAANCHAACMRMRKLGKGQSVLFCVPPEIQTRILAQKSEAGGINVLDVLNWAITETWTDMRRSMTLWAVQGQRFEHQRGLWDDVRKAGKPQMSRVDAERFLEDEAQSLEQRYRPRPDTVTCIDETSQNKTLKLIKERCHDFDGLEFGSSKLQEEQERELSPENEQERQVQKPAPAQPVAHCVHDDLRAFVSTGILIDGSDAYKPAFETLRSTSAANHLDVSQFGDSLLVTTDFANTVQASGPSYVSDVNQRPVQWILTSTPGKSSSDSMIEHMMIISPYEAQELLPKIQESDSVALHLYAPRPNLGFRALDDLSLYTIPAKLSKRPIPSDLILQLNLFAGQLYLSSFKEYVDLCKFLGLAWSKTEQGYVVAPDGFIMPGHSRMKDCTSTFKDSPVQFLKVLMTKIRRNCEGIDKTHLGAILDGRLLLPSDFGEPEDDVDHRLEK